MENLYVNSSRKGQIKIQEMAFVLVAIAIFFALVAVLYLSIRMSGLKQDVGVLNENEANNIVRKIASSPEFAWTATDCENCIDMDKLMVIKNLTVYKSFFGVDYLKVERVYPTVKDECTWGNYPDCGSITLVSSGSFGTPSSAFVSLCRYDFKDSQSYVRCDVGKIYATKRTK